MSSNLEAVGTTVIVKVRDADEVTEGGIVLPETVRDKERPQVGEVLSVGDKVKANLHEHDIVIFAKYAGTDMNMPDGTQLLVLNEHDVLAKWLTDAQTLMQTRRLRDAVPSPA